MNTIPAVPEIKDNPKCIARITVRAHKGRSKMRIGSQTHRIVGIFHRSPSSSAVNTEASDHGYVKDR